MLKSEHPISLLCDLLAVSRSSFYYQPVEADDSDLREAVNQLAAPVPDLRLPPTRRASRASALQVDN